MEAEMKTKLTELLNIETGYLHGHAVRGLKNKMTDKYIELEKEKVPYDQLHDLVVGTSKKAPIDRDVEWGLVQAGQSLSVIKSIESCEQIIQNMIAEFKTAIKMQQYIIN
jgi:enoyl-[acyl-carrier protein] reductase II